VTEHVALYCRLSPRPDGTYEGVDAQERWGRDYAARTWPGIPVEVFADKGVSAANGDHRPDFERFREWVRAGRVGHVWTVEQSRLERREVGWFELAAELVAAGIAEVHTKRDGIVRVEDEVAGIKAVLNAAEVRKVKKRTRDRLAELAAAGRPHGGNTFGYEHAEDAEGRKILEIVPEQAEVLREAAGKLLAGWSLTNTAAELDRRGIRGARGQRITYGTLKRMVTNPTVAGYRAHKGRITGHGTWQPILDEDTWRALRAKLDKPRAVRTRNGGTYEITQQQYGPHSRRSRRRYLLTGGLARCGVCGSPMRAQVRRVRGRPLGATYVCAESYCVGIGADGLEARVRDDLLDALDRPDFLAMLADEDVTERRDAITTALDALDRRRDKLARMWAADELTDTEWTAGRSELDARQAELRAELDALPPHITTIDFAEVRQAWPAMTLDERRDVVELFVSRVVVDRTATRGRNTVDTDRVRVEWRMVRR
jgi:site-specific DNA recombinase